MFYTHMSTAVGELTLISDGEALTGVYMNSEELPVGAQLNGSVPVLVKAEQQLREYFDGKRSEFDLPLKMYGTDFQKRVWRELQKIPFGTTISYGELSHRIGNPNASRAVGLANGRNPISIVVPCHRVIGANGSLTGYGGGLPNKKILLDLEQGVTAQKLCFA